MYVLLSYLQSASLLKFNRNEAPRSVSIVIILPDATS